MKIKFPSYVTQNYLCVIIIKFPSYTTLRWPINDISDVPRFFRKKDQPLFFPTAISGGNVFSTVITSGNLFPTVISSRNVFATVITSGKLFPTVTLFIIFYY